VRFEHQVYFGEVYLEHFFESKVEDSVHISLNREWVWLYDVDYML
jgi:hypothetical protein